MGKRWWTQPFGLPASADRGLADLTDRQVLVARLSLILVPLMVIGAAVATGRWYLLILGVSPFFNLFVVMPPSHRRRVLGR